MRPLDEAALVQLCQAAITRGDTVLAMQLGAQLDQLCPPRPTAPAMGAALWYAEQGLHVFPLRPGQKAPLPGSRGCKDATTDPALIRSWWLKYPDANLGIATGYLVDVIDIDGPEGVKSWAQEADQLPKVLGVVSTPRHGGSHLYVQATGEGNRAGILPGVDYRGIGGYVVAPPSQTQTGVPYYWRRPLAVTQLVTP